MPHQSSHSLRYFPKIKIATSISVVFSILLVCLLFLGVIGTQSLNDLSDITNKLYKHPFSVSNAVRDIQYRTTAIRLDMNNIKLAKTTEEIAIFKDQITTHEQSILKLFHLIEERFLGEHNQVTNAKKHFNQWSVIRNQSIDYIENNEFSLIDENDSKKYVEIIEEEINGLLMFANNKASVFLDNANKNRDEIIKLYWFFLVLIMTIFLISSMIIVKWVIIPISRMATSLDRLAEGDVNCEITDTNRHDEIGIIANAISRLKKSTAIITNYTNTIARGDYTSIIKPRSEKDQLTYSLAKMLERLRTTRFINEGNSRLNELMRGNIDPEELSKNIIDFLCHYIDVPSGCFYVVKKNKIHLSGYYAFTNNNNIKPITFDPGEGLVGEAFIQKRLLIFTQLPSNYMKIDSALGEMALNNVYVFPFLWNNEVVALAEFGVLKKLSEETMQFIESVNISISVAVSASLVRQHEKHLVDLMKVS